MGYLWAMSLPGLVCLLVALAALERLGLWAGGRSRLPWRRRRPHAEMSSAGLDEISALFYATKHFELDQRKTELMLRDDAGEGDRRRFRLELDTAEPTAIVPGTER